MGLRGCSLNKKMQMVRHEDVRKNCEPFFSAGLLKQQCQMLHERSVPEDQLAVIGAGSHEISVAAATVKVHETRRTPSSHGAAYFNERAKGETRD